MPLKHFEPFNAHQLHCHKQAAGTLTTLMVAVNHSNYGDLTFFHNLFNHLIHVSFVLFLLTCTSTYPQHSILAYLIPSYLHVFL